MKCRFSSNELVFGAKIYDIPKMTGIMKKEVALKDVKLKNYTAFIGGYVYTPQNNIRKQNLLFKDSKLVAVDDFQLSKVDSPVEIVNLNNETITPAILDEHIHGGYKINFHDSSENDIRELLKKFVNIGVGGVVATTLPGFAEDIKNQIKVLSSIIKNPKKGEAKIFGIHLEGPF